MTLKRSFEKKPLRMKLTSLLEFIEAETLSLPDRLFLDREINYVLATDLMSDCLAMMVSPAGQTLLVTGLANGSSLRTAEMLDVQNIIYCRGKSLNKENTDMAASMGINTFTCKLPMFDVIGIFYREGLRTATRLPDDA